LPRPEQADPESAGIVQESMGGKFGEMSTLMNYTYQSFNMRGKSKIRPYYDLVANIAAEEMGHIELVANTVNLLLDQTEASGDEAVPPLNFTGMTGNPDHFANFGFGTIPGGAAPASCTGCDTTPAAGLLEPVPAVDGLGARGFYGPDVTGKRPALSIIVEELGTRACAQTPST
jgi:hypothetical protein